MERMSVRGDNKGSVRDRNAPVPLNDPPRPLRSTRKMQIHIEKAERFVAPTVGEGWGKWSSDGYVFTVVMRLTGRDGLELSTTV